MRISDWSSDVCSSYLTEFPGNARVESRRFELTDFAQGPRKASLGLRRLMEDEVNVLRYEHIESAAQSHSRFAALEDTQQVPDMYSDCASGPVDVMQSEEGRVGKAVVSPVRQWV